MNFEIFEFIHVNFFIYLFTYLRPATLYIFVYNNEYIHSNYYCQYIKRDNICIYKYKNYFYENG